MAHQTMAAVSRAEATRLNDEWTRIFETGDVSRIDGLLARNFVDHTPPPGVGTDVDAVKTYIRELGAAFTDLRARTEDMLIEGDKVVVRSTVSGRHTGTYQGMPASNKEFKVDGIDIVRLENGKVVEHWGLFDALKMLQQLGFVEAPGSPATAGRR